MVERSQLASGESQVANDLHDVLDASSSFGNDPTLRPDHILVGTLQVWRIACNLHGG